MPFAAGDSYTSTDANNTLRGVYRDNSDHAVTGTTSETNMGATTVSGGTMGATGALHIIAAGTIAGAADTKRIRLYLDATTLICDTTAVTGTSDWWMDVWVFNTTASAQRIVATFSTPNSATNFNKDYTTSAVNTASSHNLHLTGTLANAADTITQTVFDVFVVQIT